jgi:hypothetical protein
MLLDGLSIQIHIRVGLSEVEQRLNDTTRQSYLKNNRSSLLKTAFFSKNNLKRTDSIKPFNHSQTATEELCYQLNFDVT